MLTPPRCFTCGSEIGHVSVLFRVMRDALKRKLLGNQGPSVPDVGVGPGVECLRIGADSSVDCVEIFEKLQVRSMCCRNYLAMTVHHRDHY